MVDPHTARTLVSLLQALYLLYMFQCFQTTVSFHHPFEVAITEVHQYLRHPIRSGVYESKICPFGKHMSVLGALYLVLRNAFPTLYRFNTTIFQFSLLTALFMNMNAFVYLLPILFVEIALQHT